MSKDWPLHRDLSEDDLTRTELVVREDSYIFLLSACDAILCYAFHSHLASQEETP